MSIQEWQLSRIIKERCAFATRRGTPDEILCSKHRHVRLRAAALALVKKDFVDLRVLIFVLDLSPALLHIFAGIFQILDLELEPPRLERQIARRLRSRIKMLMPPLHRWDEHAHAAPFD